MKTIVQQQVVVRLYIVKVINIVKVDAEGLSDPYLKITLGDKTIDVDGLFSRKGSSTWTTSQKCPNTRCTRCTQLFPAGPNSKYSYGTTTWLRRTSWSEPLWLTWKTGTTVPLGSPFPNTPLNKGSLRGNQSTLLTIQKWRKWDVYGSCPNVGRNTRLQWLT